MNKRIGAAITAAVIFIAINTGACANMKDSKNSGDISATNEIYQLSDIDFTLSQLSGTDSLGREVLPTAGFNSDKFISIYFFVWFGRYHTDKIFDNEKILTEYENGIVGNPQNPLWAVEGEYYNSEISANGEFHYWGEPLYGYYDAEDPWVIRKQLELLSYAQVDCLLLDLTNGVIYPEAVKGILNIIKELSATGFRVPKLAFMLNPLTGEDFSKELKEVYTEFFASGEYADCFFVANSSINPSEKPLVVGRNIITEASGGVESNFWLKTLQWHGMEIDKNNFPAMSEEVVQVNHNGFMSVTTEVYSSANNIRDIAWCSDPYLYPNEDLMRGRGWEPGDTSNGTDPDKVLAGACFQNQWNNVFASDVNFVHIQTWNEWWAQKQSNLIKPFHTSLKAVYVDTFNEPFSRDIEPVNGRLGDTTYMQLIENVRKFKGIAADSAAKHEKMTIDISRGFEAWKTVKGNYLDIEGDTIERNHKSVDPNLIYTNTTNRNDIVRLKMCNDGNNLYIMVETKDDVTAYSAGDKTWMNLFVSTGAVGGRDNYNYIVNRNPVDGITSVEKLSGTDEIETGKAKYEVSGNRIFFSISLTTLGVKSGDQIGIKAADNIGFTSINEFYLNGDCAPIGRLNYAYLLA